MRIVIFVGKREERLLSTVVDVIRKTSIIPKIYLASMSQYDWELAAAHSLDGVIDMLSSDLTKGLTGLPRDHH